MLQTMSRLFWHQKQLTNPVGYRCGAYQCCAAPYGYGMYYSELRARFELILHLLKIWSESIFYIIASRSEFCTGTDCASVPADIINACQLPLTSVGAVYLTHLYFPHNNLKIVTFVME
jgi:hypothetical protein